MGLSLPLVQRPPGGWNPFGLPTFYLNWEAIFKSLTSFSSAMIIIIYIHIYIYIYIYMELTGTVCSYLINHFD